VTGLPSHAVAPSVPIMKRPADEQVTEKV
jgi:hypothetical protein